MKLCLIRHGRTEANARRLYCGWTDVPLSDDGRRELVALKQSMNYPSPDGLRMITSGLRRTNETLHLIYGDVSAEIMPGFREMHFGRFEMHSYAELKDDPDYQAWISDTEGIIPTPGGESARVFRERVLEAFETLKSDSLIVCHGGVISAVMEYLFPEAGMNMYQWQPGGGRGYILENDGGKWRWKTITEKSAMVENDVDA